jgi:hypothetical protein
MDRRSTLSRAAAQGLLSALTVAFGACSGPQASPTTPVAPMDPVPATTTGDGARSRRVAPAPPPLPAGTVQPSARVAHERERDQACCRGLNACKGQGGCADSNHDCAGINECKGTSTACPPNSAAAQDPNASPKDCCKGKNDCKGKSECKIPGDHACRGQNDCKGKGWACIPSLLTTP